MRLKYVLQLQTDFFFLAENGSFDSKDCRPLSYPYILTVGHKTDNL